MSRTFRIPKCPYDLKERIYLKSDVTVDPGLTVLVGCNGSGKTTFLSFIKDKLKHEGIPFISYDNYSDGGQMSISRSLMFGGNVNAFATLATSSEGEKIFLNVADFATQIGKFVQRYRGVEELYILLDGIDSGLSIDNVTEIKEQLFRTVLSDNQEVDIYIIVSANTFEMCFNERCLDVRTGKYRQFKSYPAYRNFVLKSREHKDKRYTN